MPIIYCPVCGKNIKFNNACTRCGYEETTDYEVYPTLDRIKSDIKSIEYRRQENENRKFELHLEDIKKQIVIINKKVEIITEQLKQSVIQSEVNKEQRNHVIGETLYFGQYMQDAKGNEKKPIEWIVLDKTEDKLLLISKYALDCKPFHDGVDSCVWDTCSLKNWLNSSFIVDAFNSIEAGRIVETKDKVFLLSIQELEKYFQSNEVRKCRLTKYAKINNAFEDSKGNGIWWLRSTGYVADSTVVVNSVGGIYYDGYDNRSSIIAVRPALWITL